MKKITSLIFTLLIFSNSKMINSAASAKANNIYAGTYELVYKYTKPTLKLNTDMSFIMTVNVCEGTFEIKGNYTISKNSIILNFKPNQYTGFAAKNDTQYTLEIISANKLIFKSNPILCAPHKDHVFARKK